MRTFSPQDLAPEAFCAAIEGHQVSIQVLPMLGANLASLEVDGREFMHFDAQALLADTPEMTGAFQMFPTPCRLTGSRYVFEGREIRQRKHGEDVSIHGLVRDEPFAITRSEREIVAALDITEGHPVYEGFPFPGRLTTRYRLLARGVEVHSAFENRGPSSAPVGYGLHPYWRIPGRRVPAPRPVRERGRAGALVRIPADHVMELVDLIPTGKLIPVAGTEYDWREFRSLEGVEIDAVFYPRSIGGAAHLAFPDEGVALKLEASENLKHMICYAPAGQPFVCLENLTCSPDAPNLYRRGFRDESGLTIVPSGARLSGWIRYTVQPF
jgi:aldose 1-epimerase